jgi:hypothetical protein
LGWMRGNFGALHTKGNTVYFNLVQFISLSIDPLQGHRPLGYRNSQEYNQLGPITNC